MMAIYGPLQLILSVVYFMMIIHIIMSWLINFQVLNLHQPLVAQIWIGEHSLVTQEVRFFTTKNKSALILLVIQNICIDCLNLF